MPPVFALVDVKSERIPVVVSSLESPGVETMVGFVEWDRPGGVAQPRGGVRDAPPSTGVDHPCGDVVGHP